MSNAIIKQDTSDHFGLFCGICNSPMNINRVWTTAVEGGCTQIRGSCKKCGNIGSRKIYWNDPTDYIHCKW